MPVRLVDGKVEEGNSRQAVGTNHLEVDLGGCRLSQLGA
jgi:hypothetical protein